MILIIIKLLCIICAAIFKALADTVSPRKGSWLSQSSPFWNINKQGKYFPHTKYPMDGWHLCNSGMLLMFIIASTITVPYAWWLQIPILGILFTLVFNFVFNKMLR